jgi:5-methylthioadenosine/S-adenosylhomocysteine deaminase
MPGLCTDPRAVIFMFSEAEVRRMKDKSALLSVCLTGAPMLPRIRIKGATIVSMDPKIGIIDRGDLLIDGGKIIAVGKNVGSWAVTEIKGHGMIAMPGFVNGHIHLWQTALRGIAVDWTVDEYFGALIGKLVGRYTPDDVYIGNLIGALDQMNSGITTLFDWCHIVNTPAHADAAVDALKEAQIRALFAYGTPMTLFGTKEPHPADAKRMRKERLASRDALVTMALAIRGTDFAPGTAEADIRLARELGLIASFHVACLKHGPRLQSMVDLAKQNLLGEDVNLVHANFLTDDEFRAAANNGSSVSITPEVEMHMGLGLPPTGAALKAGVRMNIGTDVVTGVSTDMFTQMRFLMQTQRALTNETFHRQETMPDKLAIKARDVLELATIKAARCFGLDTRIGSLTPGKEADVILLRKTDINMRAVPDPIAAIVLHAGVANVDTVIVGGNIVKRDGKLTYGDLSRRIAELERSSERLYSGYTSESSAA